MVKPKHSLEVQGNFIQGRFQKPTDANGEWIGKSPADYSDELGRIQYSYASVEGAIQAARGAFPVWRKKSMKERAELLKKYQSTLNRRAEEFIEILAREVGKPLWEAQTEHASMIQEIDILLNESLKFVAASEIPNIIEKTLGSYHYRPLGVMAVIGSFDFPGQFPNSHIVSALLTGNTVIFKPSEKAPLVGQLITECLHEVGIPEGVFNLIQGEKEVGRRLCVHEGVNGILFTGSYEVGARIKQDTLQQHWKLLVLEMGGKNSAIIWEDAPLEKAVYETLTSAFVSAGQRCNSTSRVIVHNKILDQFTTLFHERAKAFSIGHPLSNPFMGPLIDQGSVDRYMKFLGTASREGFEIIMRGKSLDLPIKGNYVAPSICLAKDVSIEQTKKSIYQQTEIFAPNIAIVAVNEVSEAIAQANATQYGLVTSVFTQSRDVYMKCRDELDMGLIYWNKPTTLASARLPFGGLKKSGNYFPIGVTSSLNCTVPVSCLESEQIVSSLETQSYMPGLNWTNTRKKT